MVNLLLGVGNSLLGDDGVGNYIASRFKAPGWIAIDSGTTPENFTGVIRRERPEVLIIVDAADMGLAPGDFRIVRPADIASVTVGTHSLPLNLLIEYLAGSAGRVIFIGIQPRQMAMERGVSDAVKAGAETLMIMLARGNLADIATHAP